MVRGDGGFWPCRTVGWPTDESRNVDRIEAAAEAGDWKAAAWLLERYYGIGYRDEIRAADGVDELADRRRDRRAAAE